MSDLDRTLCQTCNHWYNGANGWACMRTRMLPEKDYCHKYDMKGAYAEERIEDLEQRIADLEDRAGVPRPCPRCGGMVTLVRYDRSTIVHSQWFVDCTECPKYNTDLYDYWQDAWREHEANCLAAEEDEG